MKKIASAITFSLLVAMASIVTSCSKDDNNDGMADPSGGYDPVQVSGAVEVPGGSSIDVASLAVHGGAISTALPSGSGEFSIDLNRNTAQLVSAVLPNGNPVLFNVAINPQSSEAIELSAYTTARSLIFLNPGVVASEPELAGAIMDLIDQLPETATLAAHIASGLISDPDILVKEDAMINSALAAAVHKLMQEIGEISGGDKSGNPYQINRYMQSKHIDAADRPAEKSSTGTSGDPWISPLEEQSGLTVMAVKQSENKYEIRITNSKKRFVQAFLDLPSGENLGSAFLSSRKSLLSLSPLEPTTEKISSVLDVEAHPNSILYVYGLGALDHEPLVGSPQWEERSFKPVMFTALFDFLVPMLDVVTGVKGFNKISATGDPTGVCALILKEMDGDITLKNQIAVYLGVGDFSNALSTAVKAAVQVCIQNPTLIAKYVTGNSVSGSLIKLLTANMVAPLRAVVIGTTVLDLVAAHYDFVTSGLLEKWTIATAQSYDGVWNGTFFYTAKVPQDPDPPLIVYESFNLSITMVSLASIPGFDQVLNITAATCSDPTFGATWPVIPVAPISIAMLPEFYGGIPGTGMGFRIEFPNGSSIYTNNTVENSFTVDPNGQYISSNEIVNEEAFGASGILGNANDPGSGPGGYAWNWCTFTGWTFIRENK